MEKFSQLKTKLLPSRKRGPRLLSKMVYALLVSLFLPVTFQKLICEESKADITEIFVTGNKRVEKDAILEVISLKPGMKLDGEKIRKDMETLYNLGYFSNIKFTLTAADKIEIQVKELPAISSIEIIGNHELKEEDLKDLFETKVYTIINEGKIKEDCEKIEKKYSEKGFFLAKVNFEIKEISQEEIGLKFIVHEHGKVFVRTISINGAKTYSYADFSPYFALQPLSRASSYGSSSLFQEDLLERDTELLAFYYKDHGFAEVKVSKPDALLEINKHTVTVHYTLEEGVQYNVGTITFSGDLGPDLYEEKDLQTFIKLKNGELFKYSYFIKDIETLVEKYGDLGYAYVDVNPIPKFYPDKKYVDINFQINKGTKVYLGLINIVGNKKSRDNVVRRELLVSEGQLYSGSGISKSKDNIHRLGFFEEVQVLKERDPKQEESVDLKIKIKEQPTGKLNASVAYSPGGETQQSWTGQTRYEEKNQSGYGWETNLTGKFSNPRNWEISSGFLNPKVYDSQWSYGLDLSYQIQEIQPFSDITVPQRNITASTSVGRTIVELIRGTVYLQTVHTKKLADIYLFEGFQLDGVRNTIGTAVSRKDLNNYMDPTSGTSVNVRQNFSGGIMGGDFTFMETTADGSVYLPIDFSEGFRTYFKFTSSFAKLWPGEDKPVPLNERYRLGGYNNLRGYQFWSIGPYEKKGRSPLGRYENYNVGGNRQFYLQGEYFLPLVPQAGLKALIFSDWGRVFTEDQEFNFSHLSGDVGFGLRWITPIAPFRFEWAYPYNPATRELGDLHFVFNVGY